jgi:hypothetical protein
MLNIRLRTIFLAPALLLGGCKVHLHKAATAAPVRVPITDACAVLTPQEISAVLGMPIDPGQHTFVGSKLFCNWTAAGASGDDAEKLALHFISVAGFQGEKIPGAGMQVAPAPGIGDDAIYVTTRHDLNLLVRKGNTAVSFNLVNLALSPEEIMAKEKALGMAAAARL